MAKTLRTSGDYTIKTGTGASGSNTVFFDSKTTRLLGDLVVDGSRTELNTATMAIEDKFIIVNKNNFPVRRKSCRAIQTPHPHYCDA